jgi:hypothetical protein
MKDKRVIYECCGCQTWKVAKSKKRKHRPPGYWLRVYQVTEGGNHRRANHRLFACSKRCLETIVKYKIGHHLRYG